jgi:hypothetical protein
MNTIQERTKIINSIFQHRKIIDQLLADIENAPDDDDDLQSHLSKEYSKALDELQSLENKYVSILPEKILSRCPYTNNIFKLNIDTIGLDGSWWDAERPIRLVENEIESFFALTGSINITGETPKIPFLVKPGPAVPWVSPRLLNHQNIMAVLSHTKIGVYDAYVTVYYSKDKTVEIERINTWGTDCYIANNLEGFAIIGSTYDDEEEYDFDIAPWIKKGKLKWIDPNDDTLSLMDSVDDCPFLNISGYKYPVLIQNGIMKNCLIKLEYDDVENEEEQIQILHTNFCPNCGEPVIKGAKFCANCGNKLN